VTQTERLLKAWKRGLTPPPRISVPDWADKYRRMARGVGSSSGRWSTATVEIARGPMLAVTEPGVHIVTAMVATQLLKTSLIENTVGYFAHLDPCPMLLVQPKDDAAEQFSKERITPLIKATPVLRDLIGTGKTRSAEETLLYKSFPGGFLALAGAGSPDNLARRPVRVVAYDEVDKYPITREGDPIDIGDERMGTFVNWLSLRVCSPTVEDESRIAASYAAGDQRRASVECPHCCHRQFPDFFRHVEWTKDGETHQTGAAQIYCEACGAGWSEGQRLAALKTIRWHQTKVFTCCGARHSPLDAYERAWRGGDMADPVGSVWEWWSGPRHAVYRCKCPTCGAWAVDNEHASFQAGKLYSPWTKDRPANVAKKWIAAQGDEDKKQVFFNTQLGVPYRPKVGKEIAAGTLLARREVWPGEVPDGVALITAGGDTQDDSLYVEFVGWGRDEESWALHREVLEGDPAQPEVWERLDTLLLRPWLRADGRPFVTTAACIDSGGHRTQYVYAFCRSRVARRVWAIKGDSEGSSVRSPIWPPTRRSRRSRDYKPVIIGTNAAKDSISARLQIEAPGPGYMHFGAETDAGVFDQLTGERLVVKRTSGRVYRVWKAKPGRRVEWLDCRVYAYAALWGLVVTKGLKLNHEADKVGARDVPVVRAETPDGQRSAAEKVTAQPPEPAPREKQKSQVRRSAPKTAFRR